MPLEATMLIIDNSEYMRNGDYQPTRFDAQADAVNKVVETKVDSNPENTVGIMSMAGKGPEVLVTHTKDLGSILKAVHTASRNIAGEIDIPTSIAIAQLALKHRENKNLRQRIIVFVASPLTGQAADEKAMVKLAKKLKKNNVAVDVVSFGDGIEEGEKNVLKAFVDTASSGDNSHLVAIPPGSHLLSEALVVSPILAGDRGMPDDIMAEAADPMAAAAGASSGGAGFEFGVDPSLDPELAMALRMSMQEAQAREASEQAGAQGSSAPAAVAPVPVPTPSVPSHTTVSTEPAQPTDDEDAAMLQQALAMSEGKEEDVEMNPAEGANEDEDMDEEEAIARAIEMSMRGEEKK